MLERRDHLEKSSEAFRTIGEMAQLLGLKTHILRYWEEQFPMLKPLKRAGGRRHYRPEDVAMLTTIQRLLSQEGYTIKGARQFLARGGVASAPVAAAIPESTSAAAGTISIDQLRAVRDRLAAALIAA
jgi:DNA-binding transcriptional MerR regulator